MTAGELDLAVAIRRRSSFCGSSSALEFLVTLALLSSGLHQGTFGDAVFLQASI